MQNEERRKSKELMQIILSLINESKNEELDEFLFSLTTYEISLREKTVAIRSSYMARKQLPNWYTLYNHTIKIHSARGENVNGHLVGIKP